MMSQNPDLRTEVSAMHEELGRLWSDSPLSQPRKAIEHFRKAFEIDPNAVFSIFSARELLNPVVATFAMLFAVTVRALPAHGRSAVSLTDTTIEPHATEWFVIVVPGWRQSEAMQSR